MVGIILGLMLAAIQLWLLNRAVSVFDKGNIPVWPLVLQFFVPIAGLFCCGLFLRSQLVRCAIALIALLLCGTCVICFMRLRRLAVEKRIAEAEKKSALSENLSETGAEV